jgi:hypothetical protein
MSHHLFMLAQNADDNARQAGAAIGGLSAFCCVFFVGIILFVIVAAGLWKVFVKARQPGWAAIIPFFNTYILTVIAGRPILWFVLTFIPLVNVVIFFILLLDIAKYFGKSPAFAVGLFFFPYIFFPILGFGTAQYSGPAKPF